MQLRRKTLLIIGLTFVSLVIILYTSSRLILLDGFVSLEQQAIEQHVQRVTSALSDRIDAMDTLTWDWAAWDDTYAYIEDGNEAYITSNVNDLTFTDSELNLILFVNVAGKVVFGDGFDFETEERTPVPQSVQDLLTPEHLLNLSDPESALVGLQMLPEGPLMLSARPILTSEAEGPIRGTLIMGRYLDATVVDLLAETTHLSLEMALFDSGQLAEDFQAARLALTEATTPSFIVPVDTKTITGYGTSSDLEGNPALIWRVDMPRDIVAQGEASLQYFLVSMVIVGVVFTILMLILLDKFVLARISRLNDVVNTIRRDADFSKRITMSGQDELANFAGAMNDMLAALAKAQDDLKTALKFKSQVLANVSHDARTPISVISLRAEMLESGMFGEVTAEQNELIQSILSSSKQLLYFLNNLLDASQLEVGKLALRNHDFFPATLLSDVESSLAPLAEKKGLTLNVTGGQVLPEQLYGDRERLQQIIFNLVGNAVKFTEEGDVTVAVSRPQDHQWAIQVSDTGPGIPEDAQKWLFEAFYQVDGSITRQKTEGVGLGLSIVKELVDMMAGQVTVTSELGVGSTFTVTLPLKQAEQVKQAEQGVKSNGRVLVTDR